MITIKTDRDHGCTLLRGDVNMEDHDAPHLSVVEGSLRAVRSSLPALRCVTGHFRAVNMTLKHVPALKAVGHAIVNNIGFLPRLDYVDSLESWGENLHADVNSIGKAEIEGSNQMLNVRSIEYLLVTEGCKQVSFPTLVSVNCAKLYSHVHMPCLQMADILFIDADKPIILPNLQRASHIIAKSEVHVPSLINVSTVATIGNGKVLTKAISLAGYAPENIPDTAEALEELPTYKYMKSWIKSREYGKLIFSNDSYAIDALLVGNARLRW